MFFFSFFSPHFMPVIYFIFAENPSRIPKNNFLCDKTQEVL